MSDLRTAAQQALDALKMMRDEYEEYACPACDHADAAIYALRSALAEPVQEELKPKLGKRAIKAFEAALAQVEKETAHAAEDWQDTTQIGYVVKPYTAPPQRKPLTDDEIYEMYNALWRSPETVAFAMRLCWHSARAIERAHGIGGQDEP